MARSSLKTSEGYAPRRLPPTRMWGALGLACLSLGLAQAEAPPDSADQLLLRGRYAEAAEVYQGLTESDPVSAAVGRARCDLARGRSADARATLEAAAQRHPGSPKLQAELALLAWRRGELAAAEDYAQEAQRLDEDCLAARYVLARLDQQAGRLDKAGEAYAWFVKRYNQPPPIEDPESLLWIGRAAAEHGRWKRLPDQFQFLVGKLYPALLRRDADFWPAHWEAGKLYLEKYNEAEASRHFQRALAINPQAAEVHASLAEMALTNYDLDVADRELRRACEINPELAQAWELRADWELANFRIAEARQALETARRLNPIAESTLARQAALEALVGSQGLRGAGGPAARLIDEVVGRNPSCGEFFFLLGQRLEERRRFPDAEYAFGEASRRMPELLGPQASLGMMYMRLGREDEARTALSAALEADPFHVRASNMAQVLEVLEGYQTRETDHFILRHDPRDELLARYAGQYLEEVFPQLCESLGYTPDERTLFEFFRSARNTSGHAWFSARTLGVPYVGTVGACAGTMVAVASPNDMPPGEDKFNWARVLRHEFVHVLNLRQTDFHIPHWFTEGLAVLHEGYPRPAVWDELLARRVPRRELFDLSNLNLGFIRPNSAEDRDLAYCQAELYTQFLVERFGAQALAKLLEAFRATPDTPEALQRAFGVAPAEIERGYLEYLDLLVGQMRLPRPQPARGAAELIQLVRERPGDLDALAQLAEIERVRRPDLARRLAERVRRDDPRQALAALVLARLEIAAQRFDEADRLLAESIAEDAPRPDSLALRAALRRKAGDWAEAERLALLGTRHFAGDSSWLVALAETRRSAGRREALAETLTELAQIHFDELSIRRELAETYVELGQPEQAARWSLEALYVDVLDAPSHRLRGAALSACGQPAAAAEEFRTALSLDASSSAEVRALVETALRRHPDASELQSLAKQLAP